LRIHTRPAGFDYEVFSFDPAQIAQTRPQRLQSDPVRRFRFGPWNEQSDPEDLARLLCANGEWLEQACAGDEGDECPPVDH
jgi:hypothetical protein